MSNQYKLPHLPQIFQALLSGQHISAADTTWFYSIQENLENYRASFEAYGYTLVAHPRDFYYFRMSGKTNTQGPKQMALFTFLLIDQLDRIETDLENVMLTRRFIISELPHLKTERYKELMSEVGVSDENTLKKVIDGLVQYGFATMHDKECFEFETPVFRLLDICVSALKETEDIEEGEM